MISVVLTFAGNLAIGPAGRFEGWAKQPGTGIGLVAQHLSYESPDPDQGGNAYATSISHFAQAFNP
jgi:hypothetical protein